ncbi:signaling lymphocytic activation molecule isoform X2 [Mauremys mutica]|uniref:signaling lymphocytic activation molecule isoform X2 n=1 Tax=Mauremys mutica TaxID=74926 RepID=UPI001D16F8FD|nr:signaling lymphocytic activation molecule isoform X2 [Mauremys mutica]
MDCSECILLIISFCCAGGMSSGLEKTVYGSLGGPSLLNITPELQNFTVQFRDARWKRSASNGGTKTSTFLASYDGKNYTNYMKERIKFHPDNFSLEILKTMRTDAGHYEYTVTKHSEEQSLQFQLEVYERVSVPDIQMVSRTLGNESCSMNLSCVVNSGDNVTYSWNCSEGNTSQLHPYNDSFLHLSFTPGEGSVSCSCTARNRVNQQTTRFSSSVECSNKTGGLLRNELLESIVPIAIVGVLVFGAGIACWLRHRGQEEHSQLKEEKESCTIYSQVQRVEQKSSRSPPVVKTSECTTIYVSATGLPPDPAQGEALDHFKPFQAQEAATESLPQNLPPPMPPNPGVTTIYDTVMPATSPSPGNVQNCSRSGDTDGLFPCPQQKPISPAGQTFTHVHAKSHLAPQKRDKTPPCNSGWHNVSHPNRDPRL